ncbi:caspase family protein [Imperialibacter roseus]|uniref:Caspase family protein n=1 Tax=Imperialibacter roseus TaxID=1324217 RepID=A0ABZ0IX20_9BACT|nr:caspase family protein [Imperialibacter roseus]WOK09615.1 caspase family protein [Imperialibacter roseus]
MKHFLASSLLFFQFFAAIAQNLQTVIQQGHELAVLSVAQSPDSSLVATGSRDKTAKLWEVSTGREVRSFLGHTGSVNCIDFSADGQYMITSSGDKTARIWEVATGKSSFTTPVEAKYLTAVAFSHDAKYFFTGGYPNEAHLWDLETKKIVQSFRVNADQGLGYGINVAFSKDGKWLAIGEDNRTANVYSTATWEKVYMFDQAEGWCGGCATWVAFSADSKTLLVASNKTVVRKYKLSNGDLIQTYGDEVEELSGVGFSKNGNEIWVATKSSVIIWENQSGKLVKEITPETETEINEATLAANGSLLLACDNNTAYQLNIKTDQIQTTLTGLLNQRDKGGITYDPNSYWDSYIAKYIRFKNELMLSKDGTELIKGKFGTKVKRWNIASGKTVMEYKGHEKAALCYDLTDNGLTMATGGGDGRIILWNVATGDTLRIIKAHREPIFDVKFSNDEKHLISASWDATIKIYDIATGERVNYYDFQSNSVYNLLFHPTDLYVFVARLDNSLAMIELDTHLPVRTFVGHTDIVSSMKLSPNQKELLTTSWDGSIRIWDIATGLMTKKLTGHVGPVHKAIFSPDGNLVYSAGADRVIRVWDYNTSLQAKTFEGHTAEVTSLLLGNDNKMLISHALDGTTKFWDLASGKEFFEHIHFGANEWMVKNPEGYFNGTDEARKHIHFVDKTTTYSVDQFFEEFYRPDLLPQIFSNRGGSGNLKNIQTKLLKSPPPTVKIAALPADDATKAEVYVKMIDNGGGVSELRLFHNGKRMSLNTQGLSYPSGKDRSTTYRHTVDLIGGANTFEARAANNDNIESAVSNVEVVADHSSKSATCHILAVGINKYQNPKMTLNYARPDAESFSSMIDDNGTSLFKEIKLHTLFDDQASKENIIKKLDELSAVVHPEDVFIFYYAGHGSMVDNSFYFIPTESLRLYDVSSLKKNAIEASELQEHLKSIHALKQLIVMDACQSGASIELLATRGAAEEKAIAQLSRSAGIHVMASAGSEQFATEFAELGHGLFTYLLITGLQGAADGAPKDGKVTIYELKSFLDDQVPELTQKLKGTPQYPYTFSRGQDFPLVIRKE